MTPDAIEFESQDSTFVLYSDVSYDVFDDEGERVYSGSFSIRDLRELEELMPYLAARQSTCNEQERKEPH